MSNEQVTLIFSVIVALSTIAYVILTGNLVRETRLSREFFLESYLIAFLVNSETSPDIVSLVINNIGKGVAKNVTCKVTKILTIKTQTHYQASGFLMKELNIFRLTIS